MWQSKKKEKKRKNKRLRRAQHDTTATCRPRKFE